MLVVEDSPVMRELLVHVLNADAQIEVVGRARDGVEAIEAVKRSRPDLVVMDFYMPQMDGLQATRSIMQTHPVPIVIVSGHPARAEAAFAFRLLEAGALAVLEKPPGFDHPGHGAAVEELVQTVKLMAEIKVVRRWQVREAAAPAARAAPAAVGPAGIQLVAIGASTGGPLVLQTILGALPARFRFPILIVQHIASGFTEGLVEWLGRSSGVPVQLARQHEIARPGCAYVAPEGLHMRLGRDLRIALSAEGADNGHRPSVSELFRSVADVLGRRAAGVLLTGMGTDGAAELKAMKDRGAITIAQDRESSVVHGMPGAAIRLGAATHVLSAGAIGTALARLAATPEGSPLDGAGG